MSEQKVLEVELIRYDKLVLGKILYQDDRLRDVGEIVNTGNMKIASKNMPELAGGVLYIRGSNYEKDNQVFEHMYPNASVATTMCQYIAEAIDLINEDFSERWYTC